MVDYEIRKDYFSKRYVAFSKKRGFRPVEFKEDDKSQYADKNCVFCPGNEDKTPPEVGRFPLDKEWQIRWIENKYPIFGNVSDFNYTDNFYPGFGKHYVIVETRNHFERMHEYTPDHLVNLFKVVSEITDDFEKSCKYVHYFKNEGKSSGASLKHSHSQILGFPFVPPRLLEISSALQNHPGCLMEKIIEDERRTERFVFETKHFFIFSPYASIFPFELWVVPKKHIKKISHLVLDELQDLALVFNKVLPIVYSLKQSYNIILYQAPVGSDFHMFFQILPRMSTWAGVELGTGMIVNTVMPEDAARFYRSKLQ